MFTGIIAAVGTVAGVEGAARRHGAGTAAHRVSIQLGPLADGLALGASVSVSGVCLTLATRSGSTGGFDVVPETWRRSTLGRLRPGDPVNLEAALRLGDRLDGHFVQGHVDGVGTVERIEREHDEWKLWVRTAAALMPCIVPKGSVALDGVSLTVVDVAADHFSVALVPTTLERTTLGRLQPGQTLNIETDILARLVVSRLAALTGGGEVAEPTGLTLEKLRDSGFAP